MGLSITKAIVDAHGGSIDVFSEEGCGATFRIRLGGFLEDQTKTQVRVPLPMDRVMSETGIVD